MLKDQDHESRLAAKRAKYAELIESARAAARFYYKQNRERLRARQAEYRAELLKRDPEGYRARMRAHSTKWREANRERHREYHRSYYRRHKEKILARMRAAYAAKKAVA